MTIQHVWYRLHTNNEIQIIYKFTLYISELKKNFIFSMVCIIPYLESGSVGFDNKPYFTFSLSISLSISYK